MTTFQQFQSLSVGDIIPLKTVLTNTFFMGVVTDPNVPNQFAATMEMFGDTAVVTLPVLVGPPGKPGEPMFALRFQADPLSVYPTPQDLPTLTNTEADIGKYWIFAESDEQGNIISTAMYVWYGTEYRQLPVGSQGPPGPYPVIDPLVVPEPPGSHNGPNGEAYWVEVEGGIANPTWTLHGAFPEGPRGYNGSALQLASDVDFETRPPEPGDFLRCSNRLNPAGEYIWEPVPLGMIVPQPITIPESAFQDFAGIAGQIQTVGTFALPILEFYWKPWVFGQLKIFGVQLSATPMLVGAEVRLGHPTTGPVIARGHGNAFGTVTLIPHTSTPDFPNIAMSPKNALGRIVPNHTGTQATLYVNVINEGLVGTFDFNPPDAQLAVLQLPVPPPGA